MKDDFNLVLCPHCKKDAREHFMVTSLELENRNTKFDNENTLDNNFKSYYADLLIIKCSHCNKFIATIPSSKSVLTISYTDHKNKYQTKEY